MSAVGENASAAECSLLVSFRVGGSGIRQKFRLPTIATKILDEACYPITKLRRAARGNERQPIDCYPYNAKSRELQSCHLPQ